MDRSSKLYERALKVFPGGVNSPVRAAVKPRPFFVARSEGAYLYTEDGHKLVDYVLGYGPLILGHRHPSVEDAVSATLSRGWLYGAPSDLEVELAEKILSHVMPGGMVRFVNSGTEATMTAVRLARGVTGRRYIVKFDGNYHGSHDYVLVAAGSAASHFGAPTSRGVPSEVASLTIVVPYNDLAALERVFQEHGSDIAAAIVEPVAANSGVIPPVKGFLESLARLARDNGALLILDEVVTGFRLGLGGAQEYFGVRGDIVVLGKIIGGGFPIGAVVGPKEVMGELAPSGKVFNAGTFNAHPVSMAAGYATLKVLEEGNVYSIAREAAKALHDEIDSILGSSGLEYTINIVESMLQFYIGVEKVENAGHVRSANTKLYTAFHESALKEGVFIAPSNLEAIFTGLPHEGRALDESLEGVRKALKSVL